MSERDKTRATPWKQYCFKSFPGWYKVDYPSSTYIDEEVSLRNRILLPMPQPQLNTPQWLSFVREMRHLKHQVPIVETLTRQQVILKYTGAKRTRYEKAAISLMTKPLNKRDSYIDCFLKVEKMPHETLKIKAPRVIQGRSPRYNLELMRYLRPIEHWFYQKPEILKTNSLEQRALKIQQLLDKHDNPTVYQIDCSKCDAHTTHHVLRLEHNIYKKASRNDAKCSQMLDWQLLNVGFTPNGWTYKTTGRRASGDFNTGLGTSIICRSLLKGCIKYHRLRASFVCDGDDCMLITSGKLTRAQIEQVRYYYLQCGYEITLDECENYEEAIHCQTALIKTPTPIMVRKPWDTISKCMVSQKYFTDSKTASAFLHQMATCELSIHRGVPIMQSFFRMILRSTKPNNRNYSDEFQHRLVLVKQLCDNRQDITTEARISFELSFKVDIATQYYWEEVFDNWKLDTSIFDSQH
ncbi:hypothetical protein 2 [Hubei tombus-like virus 11]|uniref:hypothetical protein 2 n=1 Tax=Hubei tombus-like virus 11 TaxID=1923257 RepID=UPI000909B657|nr:hypothetical protein 2 [Hubei tombus-like virus 11]APG76556.1 hypothetical protein 2 [Hubei tombus-like virus 11]